MMQDLVGSHLLINKDGSSKIIPKQEEVVSTRKRYSCDECDFTSVHLAALKRHKQNLHGQLQELYRCTVCNYATKYKSSLKRHMDYQHDKDNQKVNKCTLCDYTSSYTSTVERHLQTVHHRAREFFCSHCDYSTVHKFSLDRHVRLLHQLDKSFMCDLCDFTTRRKSHLKLHISTAHHDKKPHKCAVCGYETLYRTALIRHASTTECGTAGLQQPLIPPLPAVSLTETDIETTTTTVTTSSQSVLKEEPMSDYAEIITVPISLTCIPHESLDHHQIFLNPEPPQEARGPPSSQQEIYTSLTSLGPDTIELQQPAASHLSTATAAAAGQIKTNQTITGHVEGAGEQIVVTAMDHPTSQPIGSDAEASSSSPAITAAGGGGDGSVFITDNILAGADNMLTSYIIKCSGSGGIVPSAADVDSQPPLSAAATTFIAGGDILLGGNGSMTAASNGGYLDGGPCGMLVSSSKLEDVVEDENGRDVSLEAVVVSGSLLQLRQTAATTPSSLPLPLSSALPLSSTLPSLLHITSPSSLPLTHAD